MVTTTGCHTRNRTHEEASYCKFSLVSSSAPQISSPSVTGEAHGTVRSHWVYCHLVMRSETCMSCHGFTSQSMLGECIHFCQVITSEPAPRAKPEGEEEEEEGEEKEEGEEEGDVEFFSSPAADGCHRPFSVITAQTWSRVTVIFLLVDTHSPLRGVQFISICCSVKPAAPGHHHSRSAGQPRGLADPPVWE